MITVKSKRVDRNLIIRAARKLVAIVCIGALMLGSSPAAARTQLPDAPSAQAAAKIPADQLDSLVAPIALYPDPLLSQTLVASTYPLEVVQLQQWLAQNKGLKEKALADAVKKQDWDPSIQALAALPDVVKLLAENIKWTTDLGNAFLAQQKDVMDAVQRMRKKAKDAGNLKSSEQVKVETKTVESTQVIVVEQANPQVIYVPSYNPTVVYGAPVYAYPPIVYPPPGYYAAGMAISFGVGVAMGAMWSGGWGYNCGWGGNNNVTINNNNNFVNNSNRQNVNGGTRVNGGNSNWQHNPQHRGGAPYSDRATANKYGGTARGDSIQSRQNNARQNQARQQPSAGNRASNTGRGASDRNSGAGSAGNRGGASAGNMSSNRGTGADRVGNQQVRNTPSSTNRNAFGGASSGMSGSQARASSSRGSSSMGGSRGGGSRGGGGGGRRR